MRYNYKVFLIVESCLVNKIGADGPPDLETGMTTKTLSSRMLAATAAALLLGVSGCSSIAPAGGPAVSQETVTASSKSSPETPMTTERCGVEAELSSMALEQKIGQLLTVGVSGYDDALAAINDYSVGGIFIGSDVAESMLSTGQVLELQKQASLKPLVSIDEEGGRVSRMTPIAGPMISAREMAATMTVEEVRDLARKRGEEMRRVGITVDFAPSIDVSDQPDDEVIGDRSFSNDPQVVVDYARAFAEGLLEAGITPVFKHFPGHGHSSGDSHMEHVTVPPLDQLRQGDLKPFAELLNMPGTASMVGHMEVPGLTAPGEASSMSPQVYELMREGAGYGGAPYDGVIFTDDLSGMKAITDQYSVPEAVVQALVAGADSPLWISTAELPATIAAVTAAVEDGRLSEERIDVSVKRLSDLRAAHPCNE